MIGQIIPAGEQARAAALQIVLIGVALCIILLLRPRGLIGERRTVSRHLGIGGGSGARAAEPAAAKGRSKA